MRTLNEQLTNYAAYHRDRRNIATHFVGIPLIVLAVFAFTGRGFGALGPLELSPGLGVLGLGLLFYLSLDLRFGAAMAAVMVPAWRFGGWLAAQTTAVWLGGAAALFVIGWAIQFVGHRFEGKKPAFVDDLVGLLVGPLFVMVEVAFAMGLRLDVQAAVEEKVGPTRSGRPPRIVDDAGQNVTA